MLLLTKLFLTFLILTIFTAIGIHAFNPTRNVDDVNENVILTFGALVFVTLILFFVLVFTGVWILL